MIPWLHCNLCMTVSSSQMLVTSCGKVVCSQCKLKLATKSCEKCSGPCSRTIPLNDKAPKEVLNLFNDISEQLKAVFKNYNFQETQKKNLLDFKERRVQQMKTYEEELAKKKNMHVEMFNQIKEKLTNLDMREKEMREKLNRLTLDSNRNMAAGEGNDPFGPNNHFGSGFGHQGRIEDQFGLAVEGSGDGCVGGRGLFGPDLGHGRGEMPKSTRQSLEKGEGLNRSGGGQGQNGFLDMKTPAAWYMKKNKGLGEQKLSRNSPQQQLMELERRSGGGSSKKGGSPFFTSNKVTPTRRPF